MVELPGIEPDPSRPAETSRLKTRKHAKLRVATCGYVDALTGEGLGIAFGAAELLVGCVAADRPADYDRQWRRMSRQYRMLTAAALQATAYPAVRSRIVPAAARLPTVFTALVNRLAE